MHGNKAFIIHHNLMSGLQLIPRYLKIITNPNIYQVVFLRRPLEEGHCRQHTTGVNRVQAYHVSISMWRGRYLDLCSKCLKKITQRGLADILRVSSQRVKIQNYLRYCKLSLDIW
jgi:hypothetical protein